MCLIYFLCLLDSFNIFTQIFSQGRDCPSFSYHSPCQCPTRIGSAWHLIGPQHMVTWLNLLCLIVLLRIRQVNYFSLHFNSPAISVTIIPLKVKLVAGDIQLSGRVLVQQCKGFIPSTKKEKKRNKTDLTELLGQFPFLSHILRCLLFLIGLPFIVSFF